VINTETTGLPLLVVTVTGFSNIPVIVTNINQFVTDVAIFFPTIFCVSAFIYLSEK